MTIALYARQQQWPLERVEVRLRHSRNHAQDCADCMQQDTKLDRIDTEIKLDGALSAEQRAKLLGVGQRCPVHRTLTSGIHVTATSV
ncbi:MAG TPA: OsmC family protein [Gemmatimonadales bacterium]|nr:OsmC family protein [Gemmatimonadales bacterium]